MSNPTFGVWYDFRQIPGTIPYKQFYAEALDEIAAAEALGYSDVWLSEHHLVEDGYLPSPLVAAAGIAGRTSKIGIGTNVLLLPLYHPLRVAEDVAVLDLISGGRFTLGVGAGYVQFEFEAFGAERKYRPSMLQEGVAILRQAWDEGRVGFSGKRWSFPELPFTPQPERRIPIYFGANAAPAIERGVRLGDGFLGSANGGLEAVKNQYAIVQKGMTDHGKANFPYIVSGWVHLADSEEQAWREVGPGVAYQMNRYADWGTDREQPRPATLSAADFHPSRFLMGHPEQVAERLVQLYREVPYTQFCFWARLPGQNHEQARRNTERFYNEVVPAVWKAL